MVRVESIDEHAVAAALVADPPAAVAEGHDHVLPADQAVLDPHFAVVFASDGEGARESKRAAVFRANAQRRDGERTGCVPCCAHVLTG